MSKFVPEYPVGAAVVHVCNGVPTDSGGPELTAAVVVRRVNADSCRIRPADGREFTVLDRDLVYLSSSDRIAAYAPVELGASYRLVGQVLQAHDPEAIAADAEGWVDLGYFDNTDFMPSAWCADVGGLTLADVEAVLIVSRRLNAELDARVAALGS